MTHLARSRRVAGAVVLCAAVAGCHRSEERGAAAPSAHELPLPATLDSPWPDAGVPDAGAVTALRAFTCVKEFNAPKMPQGSLMIRFVPRSPTDVTFELRYRCTFNCRKVCDYAADLRVANGRMLNAGATSTRVACRRSPFSGFALDCGLFVGSDVAILVRGARVSRSVNFRMPFFFTDNLPARDEADGDLPPCMPFVAYRKSGDPNDATEAAFIDNDKLSFELDRCRFDEPGPSGTVERK